MTELPASEWWPYPIRYAWAATRGLPLPVQPDSEPLAARPPAWSPEHLEIIRAEYATYRALRQLRLLAARLGRSEPALRKMAEKLGLSSRKIGSKVAA